MLVGGFGVLMTMLAMFVSSDSVSLRLVMLSHVVMMRRLKMMMGGCVMVCRSSVVMLACRVLLFSHAKGLLIKPSASARSKMPVVNPLRPLWTRNNQDWSPAPRVALFESFCP
jgi:hypothetical protein